jgi:hypothetical protein
MDSLIIMVTGVFTHPDKQAIINLIIFIAGFVIPILFGMMLPRRKTVGYGRVIYRFMGTLMLQKRVHTLPTSILATIVTVIRSTFVDISYGVYIESRTDLTSEEKESKIQEFLNLTLGKTEQPPAQTDTDTPKPPQE